MPSAPREVVVGDRVGEGRALGKGFFNLGTSHDLALFPVGQLDFSTARILTAPLLSSPLTLDFRDSFLQGLR